MRALVVYESMYGNTMHVAQAIAEGIGDATAIEVGKAPHVLPADLDLLVVGGPTHGHGMSGPRSRTNAAERVDRPLISSTGMREWIEALEPSRRIVAAAFDTRIKGPKLITGSAADGATKALRTHGFRVVEPASFVLEGARGEPFDRVPPEELARARDWGRSLAAELVIAG